jgi:hypothetical protein
MAELDVVLEFAASRAFRFHGCKKAPGFAPGTLFISW